MPVDVDQTFEQALKDADEKLAYIPDLNELITAMLQPFNYLRTQDMVQFLREHDSAKQMALAIYDKVALEPLQDYMNPENIQTYALRIVHGAQHPHKIASYLSMSDRYSLEQRNLFSEWFRLE